MVSAFHDVLCNIVTLYKCNYILIVMFVLLAVFQSCEVHGILFKDCIVTYLLHHE